MILQELYSLYERLADDPDYELAPQGYSLQKISFCVVLHPDGRLHAIEDRRIDGRSQQIRVPGTSKPPGSGLNPRFLWDNTYYMLGYRPQDPKPERTLKAFEAFKQYHLELESQLNSPLFSAVCRFLESWLPDQATEFSLLNDVATGFGLFQIIGQTSYIHQDKAIDKWWQESLTEENQTDDVIGHCLLSGEESTIARLVPMIKGVAGGQAQKALIGFNEPAFESYGKKQAYNAPTSEEAAFKWTTALNLLLDGPMSFKHRFLLSGSTALFWTEKPTIVEDLFAQFAIQGDSALDREEAQDEALLDKLRLFLDALRQGVEYAPELAKEARTRFFLLILSDNAARVVVRRFMSGNVASLIDNLRSHYHDSAIERQFGDNSKKPDPEFPPTWLLLRQTSRDAKDIPPLLAAPLLEAVISRTLYPAGLFTNTMRRIAADRTLNYPRACIIKGYLVRNLKKEITMSLDATRREPAYLAGRLFAALEKTQADALGDINANIRDRYYGAASATPRSVFPRLMRLYSHHLGKLVKGAQINREKLMQEIMGGLDSFPAHFNLNDQGLFAIGYYHQRNAFYRRSDEADSTTETTSTNPTGE